MLGQLIANGRTSDVHHFGTDGAVKVLRPETPQHWAQAEASFTTAVRQIGVPVPEVRDVMEIEGRAAVVFERIEGPSMWQRMLDHQNDVVALTRELESIQRGIHGVGVPDGLPSLVERVRLKVSVATELGDDERVAAEELLLRQPRGAAVLHGDLHPGNVLLGANGPVVIDWFDATVGHPAADVARTMLLLTRSATDMRHLPGATESLISAIRDQYRASVGDRVSPERLHAWCRVRAAARIAEHTDLDASGLVALWRAALPGVSHR